MREIKFRALDKACNCYVTDNTRLYLNGCVSIEGVYATTDVTLEQFTGLLDKTGVEIYEGDITDLGEVIWNEESAEFFVGGLNIQAYGCKPKVIGDIHENPELLEGE